jgi:hypothetical protein
MGQSIANQILALKRTVFWDMIGFLLAAYFAYSFTLTAEAVYSSNMSVYFYQTTRYHIPENSAFQSPL